MEIPENLIYASRAAVEYRDGSFVVELPESTVQNSGITEDDIVQIAVLGTDDRMEVTREHKPDDQPLDEGDELTVKIESIGEKGDGIAYTQEGFVVIIPDTNEGDEARVKVTDVHRDFAMAEVVNFVDRGIATSR